MAYTAEERGLIWLCGCSGLELRERAALLRAADGDAEKLFEEFEKFSERLIDEDKNRVYKRGGRARREEELDRLLADLDEKGRFAVFSASEDYPFPLAQINAYPPLVLFGEGNRSLLGEKMFTIVGSRTAPPWAVRFGTKVAEELTERFVVVTGLAEGGDSAAIRGALPSGKLISVLPCGLDECYPAAHASLKREIAEKGLLLSECAPREPVKKYSFHLRNRILAGLSEGTLILAAGEKSGTLITAGHAIEFGRDLFAVPYNPGVSQGEGCNKLIKTGAYVCTSSQDIFDLYGMTRKSAERPPLTAEEAELLDLLRAEGELHAAVLADRMGRPVFEVAALLSALEIKGFVVKAGGNRYTAL